MTAPPGSTEPTRLSRAFLYLAYAGMFALLGGGAMFFSAWLYFQFDEALGWPGGAGNLSGMVALLGLMRYLKAGRGWRGLLPGFLDSGTATALLIANVTTATVILWAADPALATGMLGWVRALLIGLVLTLPVYIGGAVLMERWLKSDAPWKDWFRNGNARERWMLRIVLSAAVFYLAWLAASETMFRLAAAYPVVKGTHFFFQIFLVVAVGIFMATASLSDLRSAVRSLLGALVLFEAILALTISGMAVLVALQSDNIILALAVEYLLLAPIYLGAHALIAHRPGGWDGEAGDVIVEEKARS